MTSRLQTPPTDSTRECYAPTSAHRHTNTAIAKLTEKDARVATVEKEMMERILLPERDQEHLREQNRTLRRGNAESVKKAAENVNGMKRVAESGRRLEDLDSKLQGLCDPQAAATSTYRGEARDEVDLLLGAVDGLSRAVDGVERTTSDLHDPLAREKAEHTSAKGALKDKERENDEKQQEFNNELRRMQQLHHDNISAEYRERQRRETEFGSERAAIEAARAAASARRKEEEVQRLLLGQAAASAPPWLEPEPEPDFDHGAMREELGAMKASQLEKKAQEDGVVVTAIEAATDADNVKQTLIALIMSHSQEGVPPRSLEAALASKARGTKVLKQGNYDDAI